MQIYLGGIKWTKTGSLRRQRNDQNIRASVGREPAKFGGLTEEQRGERDSERRGGR